MPLKGTDVVAKNIVAFGGGFLKHVNNVMKEVHFVLDRKVTENISISDHSLKDLAKLDHPYALRHGSQGKQIHEPYYQIHKQGGKLLDAKYGGVRKAEVVGGNLQASAVVGLDEGKVPYANYLIYGTSKMIPRPVLEGSRQEVLDESVKLIKSQLKNAVVTFQGATK